MTHRHAANVDSHVGLAHREYPHGTRARYNAQKCRCFACRRANARYETERQRDPRISAEPVRAHLATLSSKGIGLRAVSDATDVPRVALKRIQLGQPTIKRSIAEKLLATDETIIADGALVHAGETQRLLRALVAEGYSKTRIATQLGSDARVPALQFKGAYVLAKTALRVRKLYDALTAEGDDGVKPLSTREQILSALRWFDAVEAEDLFDAMGLDVRVAHMQALHRLWKSGAVERLGEKPYRYRRAA